MNRRKFLKTTGALSIPLIFNGVSLMAGSNEDMSESLKVMAANTLDCGRVLVLVQLNGGNDGLNTVIPLDQYSQLSSARSNVLIPSSQVLPINGTINTGLHPALTEMQNLYNDGLLSIIQGVSYPNPNFSHFFAQDIWATGNTTPGASTTGWGARGLEKVFPGYPTSYPNATEPDPPSILLGSHASLIMQSATTNMGYNSPDPNSLIQLITANPGTLPLSDYGSELGFLRLMKDQSNHYTSRIQNAYNAQSTLSTNYPNPGTNSLADQLKIVARLIGGGMQTPVYIVTHPDSFDTHNNQANSNNPAQGTHASILGKLSEAIGAFQDDITLMGVSQKVTGATFSEFGRKVKSNNSQGTDHGAAAPMFIFGEKVTGGILGSNPNIPASSTHNTHVPLQFDFRNVYSTLLQQWMCLSSAEADDVLGGTYSTLPFFSFTGLPLHEIILKGYVENKLRILKFTVSANDKVDYFDIEHSEDGSKFSVLRRQSPQRDKTLADYEIRLDDYKHEYIFYRIKCKAKNGEESYSNVLKLKTQESQQEFSVYPNPIKNHTINLEFHRKMQAPIEVSILTTTGSKLYYNQFPPSREVTFQVPAMFDEETLYLLSVEVDRNIYTEKILFEY